MRRLCPYTRIPRSLAAAVTAAVLTAAAPVAAGIARADSPSLPATDTFIPGDGVSLHVHSVGGPAGQVVIAIHGGPGQSMQPMQALDTLAGPSREVITYDQRGSGQSTTPADGDFSLEAQLADLDAVRAWSGAPSVALIGQGWGGVIAAAYTAAHPASVDKLVLVDSFPLDWGAFLAGHERLGVRVRQLQDAGLIPNPLPLPADNSCLPIFDALTPAYLFDPTLAVAPSTLWGDSCTMSTFLADVGTFQAERAELPGYVSMLQSWPGQALIMQGAADPFGLDWSDISAGELCCSASVQQVVVPGAGFMPWVEQPGPVFADLGSFLG